MNKLRILIADDERPARFGMSKALKHADYVIEEAEDGRAALEQIRSGAIDLVFLDLNMPVLDGLGVLNALEGTLELPEIVIVTANDSVQAAVDCMRAGAADYITKPYEIAQIRAIAARAHKRLLLQNQVANLQQQLDEKTGCGTMLGVSRPMRELFTMVTRAAQAPVDFLVCGETGTGKELIAREIHRLSPRVTGPFVAVNTAAIAESLAESELFGHVRGAFTGADRDRKGVFEQAHGGTLFLDEIGDMPLASQTKILRALQERTIQPVGSQSTVQVDVRVISATHQDLALSVSEGRFRQDLYYRIKGVELKIPPLRNRREDIMLLADFFLDRHSARLLASQPTKTIASKSSSLSSVDESLGSEHRPLRFSQDAADAMLAYPWPGNVRELEHAITSAAALAMSDTITAVDLNLQNSIPGPPEAGDAFREFANLPLSEARTLLVEKFERAAIRAALNAHASNVSAAARQLGMHRQSLQQKMAQLGLQKDA
jgi:DNA-binding NtrC family response regulator